MKLTIHYSCHAINKLNAHNIDYPKIIQLNKKARTRTLYGLFYLKRMNEKLV